MTSDAPTSRLRTAALANGVTWRERIAWAREQAAPPPAAASDDLDEWQSALGGHSLESRLAADGLTLAQARLAVDASQGPATDEADWWPWFADLRADTVAPTGRETSTVTSAEEASDEACLQWLAEREGDMPERGRRLPFAPLWWPAARAATDRLVSDHPDALLHVAPGAIDDLRLALLARLAEVCAPTLLTVMDRHQTLGQRILRQVDEPSDTPARVRFARTCRALAEGQLDELLVEHPVLPSLLGTVVRQWYAATAQMLQRIHDHRADLHRLFGVAPAGSLTSVAVGAGDRHNDGRTVAVLSFGDSNVVYKPRDVRLEQLWADIVGVVADHLDEPALAAVRVLSLDDGAAFGFTEFVEHRPAASAVSLRGFYRSAGATLTLLHALAATDCHHENLIARGDRLVLVDGEALFETRTNRMQGGEPDAAPMLATVLQCGLLPGWLWLEGRRAAVDVSALGATPESTALGGASGWRSANTDDMSYGPVTVTPRHPTSLPTAPGDLPDLEAHADDIVDGFTDGYRAIVAARDRGLADLLASSGNLRRRLIQRPTYVYALLMARSRLPEALRSAAARGMVLEHLTRPYIGAGRDPWLLLAAEQEALARLDVPLFEASLRGDSTAWPGGELPGWPGTDVVADVTARMEAMNDDDLAWQVRLIRSTIAARAFSREAADGPEAIALTATTGDERALADRVRRRVVGDALRVDGHATWMTLALVPDGERMNVQRIGTGLYDGVVGVAVYLSVAGEEELARIALQPLLAHLQPDDVAAARRQVLAVGLGWSGAGGYLRALRFLRSRGSLTEGDADDHLSAVIRALTPAMIAKDHWLDVMAGAAGLLAPLAAELRDGRLDGADRAHAEELLAAAVQHLLSRQREDGGWRTLAASAPLTGMAHGVAGIALALAEAHACLQDSEVLDAALRALAYEESTLDAEHGNWPDFRTDPAGFMLGWCAGAPGIALCRSRMLDLLPDHPSAARWRQDVEIALTTTAQAPPLPRDHVCCGNLGRVAILRHAAGRDGTRSDLAASAQRLLDATVARAGQGLPRSFLDREDDAILAIPGLMTGLSGAGLLLAGTDMAWVDDVLL